MQAVRVYAIYFVVLKKVYLLNLQKYIEFFQGKQSTPFGSGKYTANAISARLQIVIQNLPDPTKGGNFYDVSSKHNQFDSVHSIAKMYWGSNNYIQIVALSNEAIEKFTYCLMHACIC